MLDLTVGQAAGVINVAVLVAQLTLPLAVVCVLAGILRNSNNAVTWSVVGGILNASWWPTILRTDTAATTRVDKRVVLISMFSTVSLIMLAVVSIVTPLGLYENISHGSYEEVEFGYSPDLQPIGKGTPQRTDYNVSRLCGGDSLIDCPGQYHGGFNYDPMGGYNRSKNENAWISSVVPSNITEIFSSGSTGDRSLVAGAFDIEYRSFIQASNLTGYSVNGPNIDDGRKRTQAAFRTYESFIIKEQINIVEGLVVDTKAGGIGFRNHTVPINPGRGSKWTEGLLWIQPDTVCVSLNINVEYTIPDDPSGPMKVVLTDQGGFFELTKHSPPINLTDAQTRPELYARAHAGATCHNSNFMKMMAMARFETGIGKKFYLEALHQVHNGVNIEQFQDPYNTRLIPGLDLVLEQPSTPHFNVEQGDDLCDAGAASHGFRYFQPPGLGNISNIAAGTGLMIGAARRSDGGSDRLDSGSTWNAPFYCCATALKAHIMDVSFQINGSNSLANLQVTSMKPRTYSSHASLPLWAVEDTGLNYTDAAPFWGIVDGKYESGPHLWTSRSDHLYLPCGVDIESVDLSSIAATASAHAPHAALQEVYRDIFKNPSSDGPDYWLPDYSGLTNYPLFRKWQELSQSSDTAPAIVNLIWTDIMANYVLGTKSTLNAHNTFSDDSDDSIERGAKGPMIRVLRSRQEIQYDLRYGIPGIFFLAFHAIAVFSALTFWVIGRIHFRYLRTLLNQTATGRCVTVERYGDAARAPTVGTRKWVQVYGDEDLGFRKESTEQHGSQSESGEITEASPPLVPEDEEFLSVVERPLEQEEHTTHQDRSTEMRLVPSRE